MKHLKVGVVGVGRMGQRHCRVFSNLRKAELVGVSDSNPVTGHKVSQDYEVPYYEHIDDLLNEVDVVCLASPTRSHYEQAMLCLDRGIHVLIEKPIAETIGQAESLAAKAENSGSVVQVGHIERFNPAYIELKHIIEEFQPVAVDLHRLSPYQGSNLDIDVVCDLMIHDTNLVLDLTGREPDKLNAFGLTAFSGTIDHAVAQLLFKDGPLLTMTASRITENKVRLINITCREAYLVCDLLNKTISKYRCTFGQYVNSNQRGITYHQESIVERINVPIFEPLFLQAQHFIDSVLDHTAPMVSARDGYFALRLAVTIRDQVLESMINMDRRSKPRNEMSAQAAPGSL